MSTSVIAPVRFCILVTNLLILSEVYPRIPSKVEKSLPILYNQNDLQSETDYAVKMISIQLSTTVIEIIGLVSGLTFFQNLQSTLSTGAHLINCLLLGLYLGYEMPNVLLSIGFYILCLPPFTIEVLLWTYTFLYKRLH